jgi:hypothetical protein
MTPKPLTIGVGYAFGRLPTIDPQFHDIPMDAIVTEDGFAWVSDPGRPRHDAAWSMEEDPDGGPCFASPPCSMHALDPSSLGYMSRIDLLDLLVQLLDGERAGARSFGMTSRRATAAQFRDTLRGIAADEARFCTMLIRHITRLGGTPSPPTGAFYERLIALEGDDQQLDPLNRGQGWVVRKLREALLRIDDGELQRDLKDMLEVHERNHDRCVESSGARQPPECQTVGRSVS